jgi:hypothetical protein
MNMSVPFLEGSVVYFLPSRITHAAIVETGIADSSHNRFIMIWRSKGASNLLTHCQMGYEIETAEEVHRNIERHDEGRWYNLVSVFCD